MYIPLVLFIEDVLNVFAHRVLGIPCKGYKIVTLVLCFFFNNFNFFSFLISMSMNFLMSPLYFDPAHSLFCQMVFNAECMKFIFLVHIGRILADISNPSGFESAS